jgi:hypothetical protein
MQQCQVGGGRASIALSKSIPSTTQTVTCGTHRALTVGRRSDVGRYIMSRIADSCIDAHPVRGERGHTALELVGQVAYNSIAAAGFIDTHRETRA